MTDLWQLGAVAAAELVRRGEVGGTGEGLPVGVQLVGRRGADEELLAVAARLEEADGWPERWPRFALG